MGLVNKRISENRDGKMLLSVNRGLIQVGNTKKMVRVIREDKLATLYINLKAGQTSLQGWFNEDQSEKK